MNNYLAYIFEVSCVFASLFLVYYLFLKRLTFHKANRIFLLLLIPLSFVVPVLDLGFEPILRGDIEIPDFNEFVSASQALATGEANAQSPFYIGRYIWLLYLTGFVFFISRLFLNAFRLIRMKQNSVSKFSDGYHFILAAVPAIFSCFNWIFIPNTKMEKYENAIIEHEKAHANLWHTLDLILTELCIALLWFNPFVFFFRKSLKSVHEFQADEHVLRGNVQKSHYLKLMYSTLETRQLVGVYSYFNRLTIKNRVIMISTNKSHKTQIIKYLFLVPVIAFMTMAFSKPVSSPPSIFPIKAGEYHKISSAFGIKRVNPFNKNEIVHGGIDITAEEGIAVLATGDGKVKNVSDEKGWGKLIVIDHGKGYETWYAHLNDFNVKEGRKVKKGETIGYVGNTGYSTGPHLHYEVRLNEEKVDPMKYVD